mmetsp:Transcript_15240/g.32940  ORF Transcript_15240/g.32940 Transcript_15240/m.32940 type:complete len:217 (-) Transcript_15240:295-945(-)
MAEHYILAVACLPSTLRLDVTLPPSNSTFIPLWKACKRHNMSYQSASCEESPIEAQTTVQSYRYRDSTHIPSSWHVAPHACPDSCSDLHMTSIFHALGEVFCPPVCTLVEVLSIRRLDHQKSIVQMYPQLYQMSCLERIVDYLHQPPARHISLSQNLAFVSAYLSPSTASCPMSQSTQLFALCFHRDNSRGCDQSLLQLPTHLLWHGSRATPVSVN